MSDKTKRILLKDIKLALYYKQLLKKFLPEILKNLI